jgi:hypothetical protein
MIQPTSNIRNIVQMNKAFDRMYRRINKMIYYNPECFCKLHPKEMPVIEKILAALYQDYTEHKDDKDYAGIKVTPLSEMVGMTEGSLKSVIWMLIPQFVYIRTYGAGNTVARKFKLNVVGVELVEKLMSAPEQEEQVHIDEEEEDEPQFDN